MALRRTTIITLGCFVLLIIIIAATEYLFIRHEIQQTVGERLEYWADDLRTIMDQNDTIDLAALRRAAPKASAFVILASDGTVIATHGFVRGSISYAALPPGSVYDQPVTVKSSLGEEWHLLARRLNGGSVVVGAPSTDSPPDISARLLNTAKGFGSSLQSAMGASFRERDANVDFAVLTDDGILWDDDGGIPLRAKKTLLNKANGPIINMAGTPFFVRKVPIIDRAKKQTGTILVMKDISLEERLLHEARLFNIVVAAIALILCGLVYVAAKARSTDPGSEKLGALKVG